MITLIALVAVILGFVAILYNSNKRRVSSVYLIRKGHHYSVRTEDFIRLPFKPGLVRNNSVVFDVMFLGGCWYDPGYDDSIHKLYGICYGFDPEYRSVRVGWRHVGNGRIEFYAYYHEYGQKGWKYMYSDDARGEAYRFLIGRKNDEEVEVVMWKYDVTGDGFYLVSTVDVRCSNQSDTIRWKLYPYYGGQKVAKADLRILIEEKL